jgi:two-component sensor histidine kinase
MPTILAIDDYQDNLIVLKALLTNVLPDIRLLMARSGKEGLELAQRQQPDVILLDIIMPGLDGYDVCRRLKAQAATQHIPIMMMTAIKTDTESRVKALEAGADVFVSKPFDQAELVAQINAMLRVKQAEDRLRQEKDLLEKMVQERTETLQVELQKRMQAQKELKGLLDEKDVLLREIHHRVKNNMQIISSLISLQTEKLNGQRDQQYYELFQELQNRIQTMTLVHEMLYHTENMARIDIRDYLTRLMANLWASYNISEARILPALEISNLHLPLDTAIPCGLVINELVSNCLQHAFPHERIGKVTLRLQPIPDDGKNADAPEPNQQQRFELRVKDNGVGFPQQIDFSRVETLGLTLVMGLVHQLHGEIDLVRTPETQIVIRFQVI